MEYWSVLKILWNLKTLPEQVSGFSEVAVYKVEIQKYTVFLYIRTFQSETKKKKKKPFNIASKI